MELQSPSSSHNNSRAGLTTNGHKCHKRKTPHVCRKEKKVKKQRVWKSLSKVLRRNPSKSSYSTLREEDSLSPVNGLDLNGNCADDIDWKNFSLNSRHDEAGPTILTKTMTANNISDFHNGRSRPKNVVDASSDSSSSVSDASTLQTSEQRRQELKAKKLQLQIEFYENMNRMRPRMERVMEKLETYLDAKLRRKPSDDLQFLQSI